MCIRDRLSSLARFGERLEAVVSLIAIGVLLLITNWFFHKAVSYTHLRAHETVLDLVCRLLLEKKKPSQIHILYAIIADTYTI